VIQETKKAVEEKSLPIELADKYLKLYVADIDWQPHISDLWSVSIKKYSNENLAKEHVKKAIACTVLLPYLDGTDVPEQPSKLLFWCTAWKQFNKEDWFTMFLDILKEDIDISSKRNILLNLGVLDPIDVSPIARQAFNWLYDQFSNNCDMNEVNTADAKNKFMNLVRAYGGASICSVFIHHKSNVTKVFNWKSGYFFEKQIHKIYSIDELIKIKKTELSKTNNKYIKNIKK